ncbi:gamma-glutamyltransferase [Ensifer sp. SSB1]|uniref:gamma-glutamyltransferase family protein n=1 Tax=Ensifer sp. SSB1 TaxID=2795385 RepID=UPI001A54FD14|nr:gamma-glutamyltransferase [Ensifer sp. SSB1]MBK5567085.1 gamma-glutamyltransferase [Ensifer sp. SSB1]
MLLSGGNAFDAAVAAMFAAAVVEPTSSFSFGSEAVLTFSEGKSGSVGALCGQGVAPGKATPAHFAQLGMNVIPTGPGRDAPLAFTTPGMFGAALAMLSKFGTKGFGDVIEPALEYAGTGIVNYEYMASRIEPASLSQFNLFPPGGAEIFFTEGQANKAGTKLKQPALAATLSALRDAAEAAEGTREDKIAAARHCFYSGNVGKKIVAEAQKVGGLIEDSDMSAYRESFEEPVSTSFEGYEIHGQSFWSQAPVMQQTLNILEAFDLRALGHNSADYIHTVTEALKLAFADREAFYGDPKFAAVPAAGLLDKKYGRTRAKLIDLAHTSMELPDPGTPWHYSGESPQDVVPVNWSGVDGPLEKIETGTTHISVIDSDGNFVAATPSGGAFGKSVFFSELGFTLSTRSEMFNLVANHPNCLAPGKRPRTSLVSYIVTKDGQPVMTVGCPGGDAQVQANLQIFLNIVIWQMTPQEAVEAPRFSTLSIPNSFYPHNYLKGQLAIEQGFEPRVVDDLSSRGHMVVEVATCGMGATITARNNDTGVLATSSDPRRACYAYGW